MPKSPAVTVMLDFTTPYANFVNYTNRKEATKQNIAEKNITDEDNRLVEGITQETAREIAKLIPEQTLDYVGYIGYMDRNFATKVSQKDQTGIFTDNTFNASLSEAKDIKNKLKKARSNKSILWRGVISFDNDFLAQNGLYDVKTKKVNPIGIKKAVQKAMSNVVAREKLSDSAFWWGNIHLNTGNVHVHVGISEIKSARPVVFYEKRRRKEKKGKFSQKTIKGIKSQVFNALLKEEVQDRKLRTEKIITNLRNKLLEKITNKELSKLDELDRFFIEQAINHLPKGKRLRYGSNAKDFQISKFFIDRYVDKQLAEGTEFADYQENTKELLTHYNHAYNKNNADNVEELINRRLDDLKARLGNKTLSYLKDLEPKDLLKTRSNVKQLSKNNQEAVRKSDPKATLVHSEEQWKRLGYIIDKTRAKAIEINMVVSKEEQAETGKTYKLESFYDVRFVNKTPKSKAKISIQMLTNMTKEELTELIEISKNVVKDKTKDEMLKKQIGAFKYALKLKVLEERAKELDVTLRILDEYQQPLETDKQFLDYKGKQLQELKELVNLEQEPRYRLSKEQAIRKHDLKFSHIDVIKVPISQVTSKLANEQIKEFAREKNLAFQVEDSSIFEVIKGKSTNKQDYLNELENKSKVITNKWKINQNNELIKEAKSEEEKKEYRRKNGKYLQELKALYQKLEPEKFQFDELQNRLNWNYSHDPMLRKQVSKRAEQQRKKQEKYTQAHFQPISRKFVRGISLVAKDDSYKQAKLLRQKERDEREEEKERELRI